MKKSEGFKTHVSEAFEFQVKGTDTVGDVAVRRVGYPYCFKVNAQSGVNGSVGSSANFEVAFSVAADFKFDSFYSFEIKVFESQSGIFNDVINICFAFFAVFSVLSYTRNMMAADVRDPFFIRIHIAYDVSRIFVDIVKRSAV